MIKINFGKKRENVSMELSEYDLDEEQIKILIGQLLQICDYVSSLPFVEKCISEYSYEEKGRWLEVKALMIYYFEKY